MIRDARERVVKAGYQASGLAIVLVTACSSATAVQDADVETEASPEAEYYGELYLDETDDLNLMDLVVVNFRTRRGQEIVERCDNRYDLAPGECRVMTYEIPAG